MKNINFSQKVVLFTIISAMFVYISFTISLYSEIVKSCISDLIFTTNILEIKDIKLLFYLVSIFFLTLIIYRILDGVVFLLLSIFKTKNYIKSLKIVYREKKYNIFNDHSPLVFTAGFLKPQIYISDTLLKNLKKNELKIILDHERVHTKNYDPLVKLLFKAFLKAFLPIPFSKELFISYIRVRERIAKINTSLLLKIKSKNSNTLSFYGEEFYKPANFKLIISVFSFFSFLVIFFSLTYFFISPKKVSPVSLCDDKASCISLKENEYIENLPRQCNKILYSPASNYL